MVLLEASIRALSWVNGHLLRIGYGIGIAAIAMMVAVTLVQVFFRYVLNNALPWPDEAARFGMLVAVWKSNFRRRTPSTR